jgi:type I restriction enzyme S subunit
MFGEEPVESGKWKVRKLGDVASDVKYGTSYSAVENGQYKYLRMNNLTSDGYLNLEDLKFIDISDDEYEKFVVRKGDILFNRTNSREHVGKTTLYNLDEEMIIAGYLIRVRFYKEVNPYFFVQFMNIPYMKRVLKKTARGAVNQANINSQELKSLLIPVPPINLQNQFAAFVQQIDKSKFVVKQQIADLQELLDSKMQEYFS